MVNLHLFFLAEPSRAAYDDFLESLERINQLEPLPNDAPDTAKQQRKALMDKNRETAFGFQVCRIKLFSSHPK